MEYKGITATCSGSLFAKTWFSAVWVHKRIPSSSKMHIKSWPWGRTRSMQRKKTHFLHFKRGLNFMREKMIARLAEGRPSRKISERWREVEEEEKSAESVGAPLLSHSWVKAAKQATWPWRQRILSVWVLWLEVLGEQLQGTHRRNFYFRW